MAFVGVYRAIYDYRPQSAEELEIRDGDLLFVLEKSAEDDWWKCKKKAISDDDDEPEGLVPNNYIEEARPDHSSRALYDYTKQTDEELSFKEDTRLDVYDESDPDWTLVGSNGEYGFAPAIYIEPLQAGSAAASAPVPAAPAMPARPQSSDEPLPGEADYIGPGASPSASGSNPAAALAGIIAQKTGDAQREPEVASRRTLAAPPPSMPSRPQYTPEESEDEEAPPMPQRPKSQALPPIQTDHYSAPRSPVSRSPEPSRLAVASPPRQRTVSQPTYDPEEPQRSPGGFHLYNIHEMISHMGKNKKLPMTLGINIIKGVVMISPEKSRDGPSYEWTADKLTHYSIEGKHVFVDLVRPSKSVDFHAGAKDTAQEIVGQLGELAGYSRGEGLREVMAASAGTGSGGKKMGKMLYEFMAQGDDEVTVKADDEVIVLDDTKSDEWWMVRRMKNGKEGVVPSSYVEITGTVPQAEDSGLAQARNTVEQNRLEEQRITKEMAKRGKKGDTVGPDVALPERGSSLTGDSKGRGSSKDKRGSKAAGSKSAPNQSRVRTWTDRSGTFKVEAEFIGLREGKIHLHKNNGVKIAVPVTKMAVEDLEYVEDATGTSLEDDKPLSDIKRRSTLKSREGGANGSKVGASVEPKNDYDWFDFFLGCGCNPQICERYAHAFSKDQMGPEVLPDVNPQLLRTLGLKEGDILRVMKTLDEKFGRNKSGQEDGQEGGSGGLFSGPGGTLRNNTRKGRPAPAVQTNDVVTEDAFKPKSESPAPREAPAEAKATPLAKAPARDARGGFDDDAWDVKPARTQTPEASKPAAPIEPPKPKVNDDIAGLSLSSPPLQPTKAPSPQAAPAQSQPEIAQPPPPQAPQQPQGANQDIFDKIAALAPARQRPQPPMQQQPTGGPFNVPPPPRASSAPGFPPQQNAFGAPPLQPQLTGYNPQQPYQGQMQPQQTMYPQQGFQQFPNQPNGFMPQPTGLQGMQQNYPALQPQPTGMNFQPQSQFGQQAQTHHYGMQPQQTFQQPGMVNGAATGGSPFADPPRAPYQAQPTGMQQGMGFSPQTSSFPQQQSGTNGFPAPPPPPPQQQQPQLPPQQTGGVFGPSDPIAPLQPQKTGPAPNVRFGVTGGAQKLQAQPTGRADLSRATAQNPFGF